MSAETINLYFCAGKEPSGNDNLDLFVRCETPEEAVDHWRAYYDGWFYDEDKGNQEVLPSVYPVPFVDGEPGPIAWHEAVEAITTRYHAVEMGKEALGVSDGG